MGLIKNKDLITKVSEELKKGNYTLTKADAIANNKLAGVYKNNILVEPFYDINAEIAEEAKAAGVPNTIFSDFIKKNKDKIGEVINNIVNPGGTSGSGISNPGGNPLPPDYGNSSDFGSGKKFDWSNLLPWAIGALVLLLVWKFKDKIFG